MLCLARKKFESIVLQTSDGIIEIHVTDIYKGEKVRLAIDAPLKVGVDRKEIYEAKMRTKMMREKEKKS